MTESLSGYRIFFEVAKCGNISKAASQLYISQPAISKSIQKLEDSLGVKLFIRSSKGVLLTSEGELLYHSVSSAFRSLDEGIEEVQQMAASGMGTLRIGVSTALCRHILLPLLRDFIQQYPHIQLSITTTSTNETLKLIEDHKIDIGLVGKPDHMEDVVFEPAQAIEDCFVTTQSYMDNLKLRHVSEEEILETSTLLMLDKNNMSRQYMDDYLARNHIRTREAVDVSDLDLLIEFAKLGIGVACLIRNFVTDELASGQLIEIPLDIPIPTREVGYAYKKSHLQNQALEKFLEFKSSRLEA